MQLSDPAIIVAVIALAGSLTSPIVSAWLNRSAAKDATFKAFNEAAEGLREDMQKQLDQKEGVINTLRADLRETEEELDRQRGKRRTLEHNVEMLTLENARLTIRVSMLEEKLAATQLRGLNDRGG